MKRSLRMMVAVVAVMALMMGYAVSAENTDSGFTDVGEDHWGKEAIEEMASRGIINGYSDNTFRPGETVSRAEFAKMMVKTLQLDTYSPSSATFLDVASDHWAYKYVETAKTYLTGFRSTDGDRFKPDETAVREDMAVAVVKGLYSQGLIDDPGATDLSVLKDFEDEGSISDNLRVYVAAAVNEGIMKGDGEAFKADGSLTRAEAATLLYRLISEEKVTYDEEKVTYDTVDTPAVTTPAPEATATSADMTPSLSYSINGDQVYLNWSQVSESGFKYYKVVLSEYDSTPSYSENGYAKAIGSTGTTSWSIKSGDTYNGGDMGGVIQGGKTYYVAITAVYDGGKYTSNVKQITIPGSYTVESAASKTPELTAKVSGNGIFLDWTTTPSSNFSYYKVVMSQTSKTPSYPDYGYLTYISDASQSQYMIYEGASYKDSSYGIGGSVKNETYYVTITACYGDGKYTSNTVTVTVPSK